MTPERRQKVLLAVIPSLLIAAGFVYLFEIPLGKRAKAADLAVAAALAARPDPMHVARREAVRLDVQDQVDRRRPRGAVASGTPTGSGPTLSVSEAGEKVALLLARHGLLLVEETTGSGEALQRLPKGLAEAAKAAPGRLRTLRLRGQYSDVIAALGGIREALGDAVALELKLAAAIDGDEAREWTLVLWI